MRARKRRMRAAFPRGFLPSQRDSASRLPLSPAREDGCTPEECTASLARQTFKPTHKGLLGNPRKYQPAQKEISSQLGLIRYSEACSVHHTYS